MRLAFACLLVVGLSAGWRDADVTSPTPERNAEILVRQLAAHAKRHSSAHGASPVVRRHGEAWLAFGTTSSPIGYLGGGLGSSVIRIYRWTGTWWKLDGRVARNDLGPAQWLSAVWLTGGRAPDFAIEGCGAGDNNCLSVVSRVGGRWHAVPFDYGYGLSYEVNGVPWHHLVETEVDACGCAGGPSTWMFERYRAGVFRPASPPKQPDGCSKADFQRLAYGWQVPVLAFDRAACAGGWAIAVGSGGGYVGKLVGLFVRNDDKWGWRLLTLDNGNALPAWPAIYDLPLALLERLAARFGPTLAAEADGARLVAQLQRQYDFWWPPAEGIVDFGGSRWLVAIVPRARPKHVWDPPPSAAIVYRWTGAAWIEDGRVPRLPLSFDVGYGGWLVSLPSPAGTAAIAPDGSGPRLTNAGGWWHVAPRRASR